MNDSGLENVFYVFAKQIALENNVFLSVSYVHFFTFQNTLVE